MKYNYYAFIVSLIKGCLPEVSFALLHKKTIDLGDFVSDINCLKDDGFYWREIGELFGATQSGVYHAAHNLKEERI
jgi:hypothetical protein